MESGFTRNSSIKYTIDKKGKKIYKAKASELKIERFVNESNYGDEGKRVGHCPLNLSDFID